MIGAGQGPIGARDIRRALAEQGLSVSEATISRKLRDLDGRQLTTPVERKGRVLGAAGRQLLRSSLRRQEQSEMLSRLDRVHTVTDVIHLLRARRIIEPEAVRGGAAGVDQAAVRRLTRMVADHDTALAGDGDEIPRALVLDFHRTITSFTDNPVIATMAGIALAPGLDHVEAMLDVILQTRHISRASVAEHARICEYFVAGDADAAAEAMQDHLDRLTDETIAFTSSHGEELANRLLAAERSRHEA
ncbi:DNA-binding transcriptional regulator, GntR family [Microlunatus soli]|uniref:DNA-binding transcriptional regulator, GntR family n=1 Tax=Microlunatus soli TaxID=630515 RepID=A0A1H1YIY6_9ACTN|nr:DNA-binding transcriptional regulator, GntR family [Microlunatus soli]